MTSVWPPQFEFSDGFERWCDGVTASAMVPLGVLKEGIIRARVAGRSGITPYAARPWLVPLLCSLFSVGALFAVYFARKEPHHDRV